MHTELVQQLPHILTVFVQTHAASLWECVHIFSVKRLGILGQVGLQAPEQQVETRDELIIETVFGETATPMYQEYT